MERSHDQLHRRCRAADGPRGPRRPGRDAQPASFRPDGGEVSYRAYLESNAAVWARYGVEPLYAGFGGAPLVAESGQSWDAVAMVRYPSRQAFADMVHDPEYLANEHYRNDALTESVLQPTTPVGI
jgi:uncharacterized protein (DUF1330 family)